ncbi:unnamed protein product [Didymodactylos carnosus]|uniref:Uncharacterized protein n=1 Tax=Didymodactylos carnosus TaxID=1234261 RepID=A0A814VBY5_9BILA|nr:unnamed protein product [Didymodactylos carnosus]CAF1301106.1 unnamed protein product [Didymodactylos carnosus]CAF3950294.1 unnamed protein product [Didymodactylos carnosus]CAF4107280.1 unnamed protein product [Didymodactylos carnosus]
MGARRHISVGTTIRDIMHAKCRKKVPVHRLCSAITEKRRSRSAMIQLQVLLYDINDKMLVFGYFINIIGAVFQPY